jgi:hypothetical protein
LQPRLFDRKPDPAAEIESKPVRLREKIERLRSQMRRVGKLKQQLQAQQDAQLAVTDPDARSMSTHGKGTGVGIGWPIRDRHAVN